MKIGILTFHDGPNHGAFLQAWATQQTLKQAGYSAEIINYKNTKHLWHERNKLYFKIRDPRVTIGNLIKSRSFKSAQKYFNLGPKVKSLSKLDKLKYHIVIIGSDVVWDYNLFGYDPAFFGELNAIYRIAFSASFGSVKPDQIHPNSIKNDLNRFEAISVRDQNSQKIVHQIIDREVTLTLDPTLIHSFDETQRSYKSIPKTPYLLIYSYFHTKSSVHAAQVYAKKNKLVKYCVGYHPPFRAPKYCEKIDMTADPFDWIELFRAADTVLTSTFHGVVFAIKFQKPFIFITNIVAYQRVVSLLNQLEITHDIMNQDQDRAVYLNPDYSSVNPRLIRESIASKQWLIQQIETYAAD